MDLSYYISLCNNCERKKTFYAKECIDNCINDVIANVHDDILDEYYQNKWVYDKYLKYSGGL